MKRPTFTLPQPLSDALEVVMDGDRQWFLSHPETRWRIRTVEPAETRSNELVHLFATGPCPGCSTCTPYVLVIRWPSGRARVRYFFDGDPFQSPAEIRTGAVELIEANTDEAFLEVFQAQVQPIPWRRSA